MQSKSEQNKTGTNLKDPIGNYQKRKIFDDERWKTEGEKGLKEAALVTESNQKIAPKVPEFATRWCGCM